MEIANLKPRTAQDILTKLSQDTIDKQIEQQIQSYLNTKYAQELNSTMAYFDARIERNILPASVKESNKGVSRYPYYNYDTYITDFEGELSTIVNNVVDTAKKSGTDSSAYQEIKAKYDEVEKFYREKGSDYLGVSALVHPYAIVKLAGACGSLSNASGSFLIDRVGKRKFYEIEGDSLGGYAKTPTTTKLINWGNMDPRNRTPYSFQDFVFCKYWNKIQNNRMITLRRYAMPVTDNIEFSDYETDTDEGTGDHKDQSWTPLATAVTYFGESTGNLLSNLLSFSVGYNWKEIANNEKNPIEVTATGNNEGDELVSKSQGWLSSAMQGVSFMLGFNSKEFDPKHNTTEPLPPDPYSDGPYTNRILGPINVITKVQQRERGLNFSHDNITVTFEYVARPIGGMNTKAVLLDLLANMLVMTYSSGTWFGGMHRFKSETQGVYPFKYGDVMNSFYKGKLLGKDSGPDRLLEHFIDNGKGAGKTIMADALGTLKNIAHGFLDSVMGFFKGTKLGGKMEERSNDTSTGQTFTYKRLQSMVSAKLLKGATIPYIHSQRALLTGEPVGDWHLTIGNPLNPIAMIGNLIVDNMKITFSEELGPDDFPIGLKAEVSLKHGLGRDRDAIESMFNRGYGRIYTLPAKFKSSADFETKVDDYTGIEKDSVNDVAGYRKKYEEWSATYFGGATRGITNVKTGKLANSGAKYTGQSEEYDYFTKKQTPENSAMTRTIYRLNDWQAGWVM